MTRHLRDGQESCHVGLKNDLFQEILLFKQFMYQKKYYFNVNEYLEDKFTPLLRVERKVSTLLSNQSAESDTKLSNNYVQPLRTVSLETNL